MKFFARLGHALGPADDLDGCEQLLESTDTTPDEHLDAVVLFADVNPNRRRKVARRKADWEQLFDGS